MSWVTSVILTMSTAEEGWDPEDGPTPNLDALNALLATGVIPGTGVPPLEFLTPAMIVTKHPQCLTFGGGYGSFPQDDFIAHIKKVQWRFPENVVLIIKPDQGDSIVWRPKH